MKVSILKTKSFSFAIDSINLYKKLKERQEYVISKQLLRSGTSVGANIREANNAQSQQILFINYISLKKNVMSQFIGWNY
jgi:four helix bundle protein